MDDHDTHTCGQCQETFTVMEQFARHKYVEHSLRFTLSKAVTEKPHVFYPELVPHKRMPPVLKKEIKKRKTFNKQLVDMGNSGEQQTDINKENQCSLCSRSFRSEKSLLDHQKNAHQVYRCDQCSEVEQCNIIGEESYNKHMAAHLSMFACKFCDKKYSTIEGLELHMKNKHEWTKTGMKKPKVEPKYACTRCPKRFLNEKYVQEHLRRQHGWTKKTGFPDQDEIQVIQKTDAKDSANVANDDAAVSFVIDFATIQENAQNVPDDTTKDNHGNQKVNEGRSKKKSGIQLLCYACDQVFQDVAMLAHHLITAHITLTPHRCRLCAFSCTKRALLATHMLTVHNQELPANPRLDAIIIKDHASEETERACHQIEMETTEERTVDNVTVTATQTNDNNRDSKVDSQGTEMQNKKSDDGSVSDSIVVTRTGISETEQTSDINETKEKEILLAVDQLSAVQAILVNQETVLTQMIMEADTQGQQSSQLLMKKWMCPVCERSFTGKNQLKIHTRKHTGERPFTCQVCNRCFITKDSLNKHEVRHSDERRYKCGECGKLFKRMAHVRVHLEHTHSNERPHVCRICNKHFKTVFHVQ
ncbi:uncharacterized protein [Amphiura filiformis]|uniref:uncharacterized protein isoform X2 n=1 Tax=Amphiura filiformis TaxID=82378 RepID=UPI003B20F30A